MSHALIDYEASHRLDSIDVGTIKAEFSKLEKFESMGINISDSAKGILHDEKELSYTSNAIINAVCSAMGNTVAIQSSISSC